MFEDRSLFGPSAVFRCVRRGQMPSYAGRAADQRNVRQIDDVQGEVELGLEALSISTCHVTLKGPWLEG